MGLKKRFVKTGKLEVRAEQDGKKKQIVGYGIVYNKKARIYDDLYEIIDPGAATEILKGIPDIRCRVNHERGKLLGRTKSGTLKLIEDEYGVKYIADPPDAQWARDVMESIERRDIDGSSFTFAVEPESETRTRQEDGTILRRIHKFARIGEMGPVEEAAYVETEAEIRSRQEEYDSLTACLRTQDDAEKIAENQRTLELRKKKLALQEKM